MDTDTLFIPLGDIFINTMEAEGELCELAGTEGHCSSRGGRQERERKQWEIGVLDPHISYPSINGAI